LVALCGPHAQVHNVRMVDVLRLLDAQRAADASPFPAPADWQCDTPVALLKTRLRLTAPDPGVMTGPGTNSYLVGDADTGFVVIDPGPATPTMCSACGPQAVHPDGRGGNIRAVACTHSHPDHAPGAAPLQALCASALGAPPILGLPSAPTGAGCQRLRARPRTAAW